MAETLSVESENVLEIAGQEAARLHHEFTGTEHILLGLLACGDDIAEPLLAKHGIVAVEVRAQLARPGGAVGAETDNTQPLTARAKQVFTLASREAEALDDDEVRPEHLLLGIIRQASGVAALVLRDMGVDLAELREEVLHAHEGNERLRDEAAVLDGSQAETYGNVAGEPSSGGVRLRTVGDNHTDGSAVQAVSALAPPLCPGCGQRLADVLATMTVSPEDPGSAGRRRGPTSVTLVYCRACGHTLAATR
jgi:ATP-dependent Clp protease ATP-binding subunit ClpA